MVDESFACFREVQRSRRIRQSCPPPTNGRPDRLPDQSQWWPLLQDRPDVGSVTFRLPGQIARGLAPAHAVCLHTRYFSWPFVATQSKAYPCYKEAFASFTDSAPAESWQGILRVFRSEFGGKHPDEIFDKFDREPIAAASIAQVRLITCSASCFQRLALTCIYLWLSFSQVYRAEVNGKVVAVKIQRPAIKWQINQ